MTRWVTFGVIVLAALIVLAAGTVRPFTVKTSPSPSARTLQCDAPIYGSGHALRGDEAKLCNDKAATRAEGAAAIAGVIAAAGLFFVYVARPRR